MKDQSPSCVGRIRASALGWRRFDEPEEAKPDEQETGADLDLLLPFDESDQQRKGKDYHEHREQMAEC